MKQNVLTALAVLGMGATAHGQVLDLQLGRTANVSDAAQKSIACGAVIGDADYIGGRFTYKASETVLLLGDLGIADTDDDDLAIGGGILIEIPTKATVDFGLKTSFHTLVDGDADLLDINLMGIVSGDIPDAQGFRWYANAGLHYVDAETTSTAVIGIGGGRVRISNSTSDDDTVPALGGGLVYAFSAQVEGYLGVDALLGDLYDDTVFGLGIRWNLP